GIDGIGPKKGLKLIQKHGRLEEVLPAIGQEIPEYQEVRDIFLNGPNSDDYEVKPGVADMEGTIEMMTAYGFSEERVRAVVSKIEAARKAESSRKKQKSLDNWF
ncbi:MAG: flap structure-specific endonuclease, partial [Candidatus Methanomethylophilaceae archaeon]|nr:flap structure-specific endonuclease [Candidatus Methanomethylophilaceae archaeon]